MTRLSVTIETIVNAMLFVSNQLPYFGINITRTQSTLAIIKRAKRRVVLTHAFVCL